MCGIAGFWQHNSERESSRNIGERMAQRIAHRGPDDSGVWLDESAGITFAHRRLSIIDLSPAGHQPMVSSCGRYVLVFNGEIYNHDELRSKLAKADKHWRGHSDSESLLAAIQEYGITNAIKLCVGMFAIALWDRQQRSLTLIRDRLGEKPLYYGWQGNALLFASELKALGAHPAFRREIDRDALSLLLRLSYIPAPHSIFRGVHKLPAGTFVKFNTTAPGFGAGHLPEPTPYWSLRENAERGVQGKFRGTRDEAVTTLDRLLRDAIRSQEISDVPLGAFLSGGVDSSAVVALMQAQASRPVKTFTIGFQEKQFNEAEYAKAVAQHLGTEHTEMYVTAKDALEVIPRLPSIYDEPFSDASQIPTFLVSGIARKRVTVALSGDGGDELFGGYNRYLLTQSLWRCFGWIPLRSRRLMAFSLSAVPVHVWDRIYGAISTLLPSRFASQQAGDKITKVFELLNVESAQALYLNLLSHWKSPDDVVLGGHEPVTVITDRESKMPGLDLEQQMMLLDAMCYLPDDILVKVDRAAMAVGLETRVPFLDHRVVEFASTLPSNFKIHSGVGKWILRQVLYRYVPKHLIERPKMGFGVPIDLWLRTSLRDWAEELLAESRLIREGFFNPAPIRKKWLEHLSGKHNWQYYLWDVLMFQAWLGASGAHPSTTIPCGRTDFPN
jgi:asparagine synthase (glutamine-hydrolysing)